MDDQKYPWYDIVVGEELEQGDILEGCPVFLPPDDFAETLSEFSVFRWTERNVIVLTQTCDLVQGREKVTEVLLCPLWHRSDFQTGHLSTSRGMEDARRGILPAHHLLAPCEKEDQVREVRIVDFRSIYTLPINFARRLAQSHGPRLRVLPPYREHLAQSFARFFMRVGLPVDIPPFR